MNVKPVAGSSVPPLSYLPTRQCLFAPPPVCDPAEPLLPKGLTLNTVILGPVRCICAFLTRRVPACSCDGGFHKIPFSQPKRQASVLFCCAESLATTTLMMLRIKRVHKSVLLYCLGLYLFCLMARLHFLPEEMETTNLAFASRSFHTLSDEVACCLSN